MNYFLNQFLEEAIIEFTCVVVQPITMRQVGELPNNGTTASWTSKEALSAASCIDVRVANTSVQRLICLTIQLLR
jgi:hypothetical protein